MWLPCQRNYAKSAAKAWAAVFVKDRAQARGCRLEIMGMAEHAEVEYTTATGNDYPAHEHTYRNFVTLVKVTLAIVVVILILMAFFLT
jgi:Bacterial aa3 type cytochrome c oxidase subunit IV